MPHFVRHAMVWTIVFALVASAAAWRQCTSIEVIAAASASVQHQHASGGHDHHAMQQQDAAHKPAADTDHDCMKCCSMCTVATALLPALPAATVFAAAPAVFYFGYERWSASTVAVDPGIPITIV